jgi:23S rRNA (cytidine2498-2'-O)-methyltransferase
VSHWIATVTPGLEAALIAEVRTRRPLSRPGYRRPGLLTFTEPELRPDMPLFETERGAPSLIFPQIWGHSLGLIKDDNGLAAAVEATGLTKVQVFSRPSGDDEESPALTSRVETVAERLRTECPQVVQIPGARRGEPTLGVIVALDEPTVLVQMVRGGAWGPLPGGRWPVTVPEDSPSRAWAKLDEALAWSRLPLTAGERVLELGNAPGGVSLNLLRRGLQVLGVDSQPLAAPLQPFLDTGALQQVQRPMSQLRWEELNGPIDWLLMDVSIAPALALRGLRRLMPPLRKRLRGALLTLKLNDDAAVASLPKLLEQAGALGLGPARARHLPANRREVTVALGASR